MMNTCFDEATLQAYLDGELAPARAGEAAAHLAACRSCADAARKAAQEISMFANAFGAGESLSVPTERLRAGIDARIAEMQVPRAAAHVPSASIVERLRAFTSSLAASLAFTPRQAMALASFAVAAVLLATLFYVFRPQSSAPGASETGGQRIAKAGTPIPGASVNGGAGGASGKSADTGEQSANEPSREGESAAAGVGVNRAITQRVKSAIQREARAGGVHFVATGAKDESAAGGALLPVEKTYASAIASLKSSIDQQGARMMTPTLRAEYERNIAVVDRAIVASRVAARRDPADKDAQEFLRTAYQDKLDLLHAVADQTQIASIGR
ncbi:MAG: zf-HC2 domain-containing protein [Pyrinomonadaceae bacterium]